MVDSLYEGYQKLIFSYKAYQKVLLLGRLHMKLHYCLTRPPGCRSRLSRPSWGPQFLATLHRDKNVFIKLVVNNIGRSKTMNPRY